MHNKSISYIMKVSNTIALCTLTGMSVEGFVPSSSTIQNKISTTKNTELYFFGGGSANKEDLDEQVCFFCYCTDIREVLPVLCRLKTHTLLTHISSLPNSIIWYFTWHCVPYLTFMLHSTITVGKTTRDVKVS